MPRIANTQKATAKRIWDVVLIRTEVISKRDFIIMMVESIRRSMLEKTYPPFTASIDIGKKNIAISKELDVISFSEHSLNKLKKFFLCIRYFLNLCNLRSVLL
jgi:hypothetical protein